MAGETVITIVGNLTADPELRTTRNGGAVTNFSIAATPRVYDRQSNQWVEGMRCSCAVLPGVTSPLIARRAYRRACA